MSRWGSRSSSRWGKFAGLEHTVLHYVIFWGSHVRFWLCLLQILVIFRHHLGKRWFLNRCWYNSHGHTLAILLPAGAHLIGRLALALMVTMMLVAVFPCSNRLSSSAVYLRRFSIDHMNRSTTVIVLMRTVIIGQWLMYMDSWFSGVSLLHLCLWYCCFLLTLGWLASSPFWTISCRSVLGLSIIFLCLILGSSTFMLFLWATLLFALFFRCFDFLTRSWAFSSILLLSIFFRLSNIRWH